MPVLGIFLSIFGVGSLAALVATIMTYKMIDQINARKDSQSKLSYFGESMFEVVREYRHANPQGKHHLALFLSTALIICCGLALIYILLCVVPRYALPSR